MARVALKPSMIGTAEQELHVSASLQAASAPGTHCAGPSALHRSALPDM
jgi:hypothetical protein